MDNLTMTIAEYNRAVDLITILEQKALYAASMEMPLSEFLKNKYQELKTNDPTEFITREELTVAGLHLFSRLPGKRLTGRKGSDGRLKTISFNTHVAGFFDPGESVAVTF